MAAREREGERGRLRERQDLIMYNEIDEMKRNSKQITKHAKSQRKKRKQEI